MDLTEHFFIRYELITVVFWNSMFTVFSSKIRRNQVEKFQVEFDDRQGNCDRWNIMKDDELFITVEVKKLMKATFIFFYLHFLQILLTVLEFLFLKRSLIKISGIIKLLFK